MKAERSSRQAFTLIEVMLVVAIIAIAFTMSFPAFTKMVHRAPMTEAVVDIMDACRNARAQAILHGSPMEVRVYPQDLRLEVAAVPVDVAADSGLAQGGNVTPGSAPGPDAAPPRRYEPKSPFKSSAQLPDSIRIEMLDVNFTEFKDAEVARIRFYPNGTCDELTFIIRSDGDYRKITLEVVTALADVTDNLGAR